MARLISFGKRTRNYLPTMTTVPLPRRPPKDLSIASAALPSNNASLFHGLPAVTGMIKMEIVFILYVLFLHWQQHGYSPNNEYVGIFINKVLGLDSNLCREDLEDGQKMSSFPCTGKSPPWLFFSTLKCLLTKKQAEAQLWHQPSQSPALPIRTQGSISFLHGLQECVPGASWVIQGGFYFTRVGAWEWRGEKCGN